jgi:hypothetical protein
MPEKQKVYCGKQPILPDGYDRFAIPYQCLKKGYGACLYANRRGTCGGAPQYEQQFFNRLSNRLLFVFVVVLLFVVLLFLLNKFFMEQ